MPEERETTDVPLPTTSMKKSSKALVLVVVMKELLAAPRAVIVVSPTALSAAAVTSPFPICCPLKKILAMLEAGLVTVNVMAAFAVDCTMPEKRAAIGLPPQVPGTGVIEE